MRFLGIGTRLAVASVLGLLLLSACRSVVPVPTSPSPTPDTDGPISQRLIIVVHGDGDYLYHDPSGQPHQADAETLREAFDAAQAMPNAEVFVIHQRPASAFLGLVPRDDGTLYHFVRGTLVEQTTYKRDRSAPLAAEAEWMTAHRTTTADASLFTAALYYGHAIPERPSAGYHRSRPDIPFSIQALARGLGRLPSAGPLDVTVLSTCDGGTPHTVTALAPYTRRVVAAPGDLHLSFLDADVAGSLSTITDPEPWSRQFTKAAFERLVDRTVTAVQLATYDVDQVESTAQHMARQVPADSSTNPTGGRLVDCQRVLPEPVDTTGVRVWYRPAQFGRRADKAQHSGWACLPPPSRAE